MRQTHPNRIRNQSVDTHLIRQKQSGDQHILPESDAEEAPHRPHRLSREDMQKIERGDKPDDTAASRHK